MAKHLTLHSYGLAASQLMRIKDMGLSLTICIDQVHPKPCSEDDIVGDQGPLPSEYGTYKTVKARFWPWLSGQGP